MPAKSLQPEPAPVAPAVGLEPAARDSIPGYALPEVEVLVLCARRTLDDFSRRRLEALVTAGIDLDRLFLLGERHGLLPLLSRHLSSLDVDGLPPDGLNRLRSWQTRNSIWALQLTGRLLQVLRGFAAEGIRAVSYKGPVLASVAYGEIALRQMGDLDIFVPREDVELASKYLLENGFTFRYPLTDETRRFRLANRYSEEFVSADGTHVELHWAFANPDVSFSLTFAEAEPRLAYHEMGGMRVPTFGMEDSLLVLAVHGAKHRWDRLEWIAGVAELIRQAEGLDWSALIARADRVGSRRTLLLAFLLAHDLLDAPLPETVLAAARREPWIGALTEDVRKRLFLAPGYAGSRAETLSRNLFQLPLQKRVLGKVRYLTYRSMTPNRPHDWRVVRVGGRLLPVHAVLWPLRLVRKVVTRPFRKDAGE